MSSAVAVRLDNQLPRVELAPRRDWTHAEDASFLGESYGLTPDPWQRRVLDSWLAVSGGRWASARAGLAVPRQNGKNAVLEVRELYGMVELGEKFLHTAHEVKTARKAFLRLAGFFENPRQWPELAGLVESIRKTNGQEAILLTNGGSVEFVARSRGSGRGFTVDVLVCDEAQELNDEQLEALLPTISSSPKGNPQILLTGTPPPPGTTAEVFTRMRADGHAGDDLRLSWHEWGIKGKVDLDDRAHWYATNPAMDRRLSVESVETERAQMSDDGFARERLGSWEVSGFKALIPPEVWDALRDPESRRHGAVCWAVDVPPDRSSASICVAGRRRDDLWHVELLPRKPGTSWVVDELARLTRKHGGEVVLDPAGPAGSLLVGLADKKIEPLLVSGREMAQACGDFYDKVVDQGSVRHIGQPELSLAVDAGRQRTLGDAWAWHRRDTDSDISPLVGVTLALHGLAKPSGRREKTGRASFV